MKIVVLLPVGEARKARMAEAFPGEEMVFAAEKTVTPELIADADAIVGNPPVKMLEHCTRLKLLQLGTAGADAYIVPGAVPVGVHLATSTGAFGTPLAEHLMGMLLFLCKRHAGYLDNQRARRWQVLGNAKTIEGSRVLIVGLGDVGCAFAKRMKAMGATTVGVRRAGNSRPEYVDALCHTDRLETELPLADIVALCLPGTKETRHLLDEKRLLMMRPDAVLLNVGRGDAIDTDALARCMQAGHLWGAGLDVTETEPLPESSPLWAIPDVFITPHSAGKDHAAYTIEKKVEIAIRNIQNLVAERPLENEVDFATGYRRTDMGEGRDGA